MFKKVGEQVMDGALNKIKEQPQVEWLKFECFAGHVFAIQLPKSMLMEEYLSSLSNVHCPFCKTKSIKKEGVL